MIERHLELCAPGGIVLITTPNFRGAMQRIARSLLDGENLPANRARSIGETVWLIDTAALPENFRG